MLENHEHKHAVHEFDGIIENRVSSPPVYFTVLFYGLIVWGVIFIAWYLFSGWSSHGEFAEKMAAHTGTTVAAQALPEAAPSVAVATTSDGAALFAAHCASCHGAEGEGGFGPDLTADSYKYGRTADAVHESIANGRPDNMPAFADRLSEAEIAALTTFLLQL